MRRRFVVWCLHCGHFYTLTTTREVKWPTIHRLISATGKNDPLRDLERFSFSIATLTGLFDLSSNEEVGSLFRTRTLWEQRTPPSEKDSRPLTQTGSGPSAECGVSPRPRIPIPLVDVFQHFKFRLQRDLITCFQLIVAVRIKHGPAPAFV